MVRIEGVGSGIRPDAEWSDNDRNNDQTAGESNDRGRDAYLLSAPAHLWTGRALQEESLDGHAVRVNLSGLCLELALRAIMEICAQLSSVDPRPQGAMCGARLQLCRGDRCSIVVVSSREPRRGLDYLLLGSDKARTR